jgi:hypothetical protein
MPSPRDLVSISICALHRRGVQWVTLAKDIMAYIVRKRLLAKPTGKILRDDLILLKLKKSRARYPELIRWQLWAALLKSY